MPKLITTSALALAMGLAACADNAEDSATTEAEAETSWPGVPEEQAAQIRELGYVIDPASFEIYAPLAEFPPYDDVTIQSDIAYGDDAAQKLDVYTFKEAADGESRPVLVYVHGGGFTGGTKAGGGYYPQSATAWAARNGMVGVNIDYRLAPGSTYPAASADLAAAMDWVRANIAEHGGDPDHIVIWGHSAGGNIVADYISTESINGGDVSGVKGALLMSPYYTLDVGEEPHVYYGEDASLQTAAPAIERLGASSIPLMLVSAEYDPEVFRTFASTMVEAMCGDGSTMTCPTTLELADHNHLTEGASIGTVDESFSGPFSVWLAGL